MKCIIIEDELPAQQLLMKYIEQSSDIECIGVFESVSELPLYVLNEVDFILLDVQLPGANGLDFLKSLEIKPKVIITTAYRDYAIDAFEEAVEDYLLKPFSYHRFLKSVMRIQNTLTDKNTIHNEKELFVYTDKTFYKIIKNDICYIKSEADYIYIHYGEKKLLVQDSLSNWEYKLKEDGFIRIHRSYIINFRKIDKIEGNLVHIEKETIPIGKTYRTSFFNIIKK
ncbi:LytTR family DNA-binding domain-containing protein [Aquimarina sp. Aq78]|uniref:LytR/AlgR family response regulator transcription factor n=1 Tax=Aquimarina sp. Aq78 TaxID=1191889 RepID=UPI000D0FB58D|nr:LytTR family DNA-binding domain-containing protein [Aquimarina sp. Aq78]